VKSAVETLNPTRVKLTVEVPYDELKPSLDAAYKTIANQVAVPGFRKGKVPPRVIDQRFGRGAVIEEAVNDALPRFYLQAVEAEEVRPLGQPQVDVTEVPDAEQGGELKFTAEVDVRPAIDLPALDGVEVTVDDVEIGDDEVDAQLQNLRERFGTLVPVDREVRDGDFITIDIAATIEDEEIDSVTGVSYEVGSGQMLDGMDDVLPGMSAGETTTYTTPLAGGDRAGEEALVRLTVQSVKERSLPDADDDFAQLASEFDTLAELQDDLRRQAEQAGRYRQGLQAREKLVDVLLETVEIPVPEALVEDEIKRHLESEGKELDDPHREEVEVEARKAFQAQLLLDAVVEARQVSVSQQELVEYLVATAQQYRMDPNEFAQAVEGANQIPAMVAEVARRKALATLLETAVVKEESGAVVDLQAIFPKPEPAEDEAAEDGDEPGAQGGSKPGRPTVTTAPAADDPTALPTF
jgi:trigger factor